MRNRPILDRPVVQPGESEVYHRARRAGPEALALFEHSLMARQAARQAAEDSEATLMAKQPLAVQADRFVTLFQAKAANSSSKVEALQSVIETHVDLYRQWAANGCQPPLDRPTVIHAGQPGLENTIGTAFPQRDGTTVICMSPVPAEAMPRWERKLATRRI